MSDEAGRELELLELTVVPDVRPTIYAIGLAASRITFADQQRRAVNTIWALLKESRILPGEHIAIVGAGIAGVTAAQYAIKSGLHVTLFEQHAEPFAIQRGSSRWIHPNIYDWPEPIWRSSTTDLPCMNWKAAKAGDIVAALWPEWLGLLGSPGFTWNPSCAIAGFAEDRHRAIIVDLHGIRHGPYACAIAAIGFGEEQAIAEIDGKPYWKDDDLHQRMRDGGTAVVSGTGDGGLVDAMRIALRDFRHELLGDIADAASADHEMTRRLKEIERNTPRYPNGSELTHEILSVRAPAKVMALLEHRLRPNTTVVLNSRADFIFSRSSCMLNRFVIAQLIKLGAVRYEPGPFDPSSVTRSGAHYDCTISGHLIAAATVVVRHGPTDPALLRFPVLDTALLPVRKFLQRYSAGVDRTRTRAWGSLTRPSSPTGWSTAVTFTGAELDGLAQNIQETVHELLAASGEAPFVDYTRSGNTITLIVERDEGQRATQIVVSENKTITFQAKTPDSAGGAPVIFVAEGSVVSPSDAELRRWAVEGVVSTWT